MSNETYASYTGQLSHMDQLTICYWFNLHYHHTTISLASYCAPASNCTSVGRRPTCSNIRENTMRDGPIIGTMFLSFLWP